MARPNKFKAPCFECTQVVKEQEGYLYRIGSRYKVRHKACQPEQDKGSFDYNVLNWHRVTIRNPIGPMFEHTLDKF